MTSAPDRRFRTRKARPAPAPATFREAALDWQADAACRGHDLNIMFPRTPRHYPPIETGKHRSQNCPLCKAKEICRTCPVLIDCGLYILRIESSTGAAGRWGIWAGMTPGERQRLHRQLKEAQK